MWHLSLPWWEMVARGTVIYAFLLVVLRVAGKRQIGHLAPFDIVLLLILSNAVQNSMNGGDNSVPGGMILALTIIGLNYVVSAAAARSTTVARLVEGRGLVLVRDGKVDERTRRVAMVTREEILAALRVRDCSDIDQVRYAILENNGEITVIRKNPKAAK